MGITKRELETERFRKPSVAGSIPAIGSIIAPPIAFGMMPVPAG